MKPWRLSLLVALYLTLVIGGTLGGHLLVDLLVFDVRPSNEPQVHRLVMTASAVFVLASSVPFVPGAEIGLGLILVFGSKIILLVYASMVVALLLAYLVGRYIPPRITAAVFAWIGLNRPRDLVLQSAALDIPARLKLLTASAPSRAVPFLLRHRYIALGVAFNLPGNTLLGGGGGIALAAGMSGLYPFAPYLLTVALAVTPVPLLILLFGVRP